MLPETHKQYANMACQMHGMLYYQQMPLIYEALPESTKTMFILSCT